MLYTVDGRSLCLWKLIQYETRIASKGFAVTQLSAKTKMQQQGTEAMQLYRVFFAQPNNADHEALALIHAADDDEWKGTLFHVTGMLALGLQYQRRCSRNVRKEKGCSRHVLLGQINVCDLDRVNDICRAIDVPLDERLLFESRVKLEARGEKIRDCSSWIDEVTAELDKQGVLSKPTALYSSLVKHKNEEALP